MIYIYGHDYIKYLNDDSSGLLTYDQWKNRKSQQIAGKGASCGKEATSNYAVGHYSIGTMNKNL